MRELNIEFQEQYKRLDRLCRDMYSSGEGVSAYIQEMESTPYNKQRTVDNWDNTFIELKHLRWMRNQLAHDIPIDSVFCEQHDIDWLNNFYASILNGTDPLAIVNKSQQTTAPRYVAPPNPKNGNRQIPIEDPDKAQKNGCYIATSVYGSYDCPQVWTLRRYRDNVLSSTWYGRIFIRLYYAFSPTLVKWFGNTKWFKKMWRKKLDKIVSKLNASGVLNTPYNDLDWRKK